MRRSLAAVSAIAFRAPKPCASSTRIILPGTIISRPMRSFLRTSTDDVQDVVRQCAAHRVPLIPFGTGTSLEGQINAPFGGISLDLSRMDAILAVNAQRSRLHRAGRRHARQAQQLHSRSGPVLSDRSRRRRKSRRHGIDPCFGTNAVRYGTMRENVMALTAVLPDGSVIRTARRARKSSAGLRPHAAARRRGRNARRHHRTDAASARPAGSRSRRQYADSTTLEGACAAASLSIQSGIPLARVELLDELQIRACNIYSKLTLARSPDLVCRIPRQRPLASRNRLHSFEEIARDNGAERFYLRHQTGGSHEALAGPARCGLWRDGAAARREGHRDRCLRADFAPAGMRARNQGRTSPAASFLAPCSAMSATAIFTSRCWSTATIADEMSRAKGFIERLALRAIAMDGTCTGEHGVGQGKIAYLEAEHGPALGVMRAIKRALDPQNIMNPGKIFTPLTA